MPLSRVGPRGPGLRRGPGSGRGRSPRRRPPAAAAGAEDAYRANNVGVALLEQYRYEEAVASFRKALALAPSLAVVRVNLAIALFNAQRAEEARKEALEAARLLPGLAQTHYMLGLAARSAGATRGGAGGLPPRARRSTPRTWAPA